VVNYKRIRKKIGTHTQTHRHTLVTSCRSVCTIIRYFIMPPTTNVSVCDHGQTILGALDIILLCVWIIVVSCADVYKI